MADDLISNLLEEFQAAIAVLDPQIRGLTDLAVPGVSISDGLRTEVQGQIAERDQRKTLIENAAAALNALVADGYPDLPQDTIDQALYTELQGQMDDQKAAASVFEATPAAATATITFGQPVSKPQGG